MSVAKNPRNKKPVKLAPKPRDYRGIARNIWQNFVAVFVLFHLVAITLRALPAPGYAALNRSGWESVTAQRELKEWNRRLGLLGIKMSDAEYQDMMYNFTVAFMGLRDKILLPFDWYYRYFGTYQSWRMFVAPDTHPSYWELSIREHGQWRTIYKSRSNEFSWRRSFFDHIQVRYATFLFAWPQYSDSYESFAQWVFKKVANDFPEADLVRAVFHTFDTQTPAEKREGLPQKTTIQGKITGEFRR